MGLDYGNIRIGVAVSDPFGWTAQQKESVQVTGGVKKAALKIIELAIEYSIQKVVIGYPLNMNGTKGPAAEKVDEFIIALKANKFFKNIEIIRWDERLTTVSANRTMTEMGVCKGNKKKMVDRIAAQYILQGYLDNINKQI